MSSQPTKVTEKNEGVKSTSSQLAMDQMQRRSESMASMLSQSHLPSDQVDEPEFKKLKNGCDISLTAQRPLAVLVKPSVAVETLVKDKEKEEDEISDPWSKMPSNQLKTSKMIRSTTTFG
jgi:hypothetical protein